MMHTHLHILLILCLGKSSQDISVQESVLPDNADDGELSSCQNTRHQGNGPLGILFLIDAFLCLELLYQTLNGWGSISSVLY